MRKYYGIYCRYGANVVDNDGDRLGMVLAFDTKRQRDAWVDDDEWDGDYHRAAITSNEARRCMVKSCYFDYGMLERKYHYARNEARSAPMEAIVDCYSSAFDF